jgi:hypothetical protein
LAWEKVDDKTLVKLKEQKAFEDRVAKGLTSWQDSIKNPFVRLFIHRIILDTMRHSDTYQLLIELNERVLIGEPSREAMTTEISAHIKQEGKMLEQAKKISQTIEDAKFKQILQQIIEDEKKHHKILRELADILKREAAEWNRYLYEMSTGFP